MKLQTKYPILWMCFITYIILCVSFYISLEQIDKVPLRKFLYGYFTGDNIVTSSVNFFSIYELYFMLCAILSPILGKHFYDATSKGYFITFGRQYSDDIKNKIRNIDGFNDKLYWHRIAKQHNINMPDIYIYIDSNGKHHIWKPIDNNKNYIAKPVNGLLGIGIKRVKGKDIGKLQLKNYIIQALLIDCNINKNGSRIYRLTTFYDGTEFALTRSTRNNYFISTIASERIMCKNSCRLIVLEEIINKLKKLHQEVFPYLISIGWDIMIDCNQQTYILEGNSPHNVFMFDIVKHKDYVQKYKNEALKFYKMHKLID